MKKLANKAAKTVAEVKVFLFGCFCLLEKTIFVFLEEQTNVCRAVARILFQLRQRGKLGVPSGIQGHSPWSGLGGKAPWSWKLFRGWVPKRNGKCATILLFCDLFISHQKCLKLHIYNNAVVKCHWVTICKTVCPMLSDRCLYCLYVCRSVMYIMAKRLDGSRCHLVRR